MNPLHLELARRANELLGDGEWHDLETVMQDLMKVVPPGRALRQNERDRQTSNQQKTGSTPASRSRPQPRERLIAFGARTIVRDFLNNTRTFEVDRPGQQGNHKASLGRKVRMIGRPRALRIDPLRNSLARTQVRAEHLESQLEAAQARVAVLRKYLVEIGHEEAANRLAPDGEE